MKKEASTETAHVRQKERPMSFSAPMVRAILDGSKTQTRRIVKPQPVEGDRITTAFGGFHVGRMRDSENAWKEIHCSYGVAGDRLWVRETWRPLIDRSHSSGSQRYAYRADHPSPSAFDGTWKPAIHMPKAASRITLEITGVRVERLQEISEEDCLAEGIKMRGCSLAEDAQMLKRDYANLWDSINGKGAWDKNPWCWVLEFQRDAVKASQLMPLRTPACLPKSGSVATERKE